MNAERSEEVVITRKEERVVTITLTLTEQEAEDLKTTVGYDGTIPRAIRKSAPTSACRKADGDAAERILDPLFDALEAAGI